MSSNAINPVHSLPFTPPASPAVRAEAVAAPQVADQVTLGSTPCQAPGFHGLAGLKQFDAMDVRASDLASAQGRQLVADQMLGHLRQWPSLSAVVALAPDTQGNTSLVVASRPDAVEGSRLQGVYEVIQRLSSSTAVKVAAAQHPVAYAAAQAFDAAGQVMTVRLPGRMDEATVAQALAEGGQANRYDQLQSQISDLPQGKRVVLLIGGPSAAGKSSLIKKIREFAGERKIVEFPGDMYFRDADDGQLPKTGTGSPYWDDPRAMHFDDMSADIVRLVADGKADIPVYDFGASRPGGWKSAGVSSTGMRTEKTTPTTMGADDILVIDSIHATNKTVIGELEKLNLPHASVYLDSERAEDRLVRRMVRDFSDRGRSPERTLADWDATTFPGEVNFIRPTLTQLDPAQDVFMVTKFPKDAGFSREVINHKIEMQKKQGLMPTYEAFATADEKLPELARSERQRLETVMANPQATDAERKLAQRGLDLLKEAGN